MQNRAPGGEARKRTGGGPFEVEIEKMVYGGNGLGRHEGKVVFVPFTTPGDRVLVRPLRRKKNYVQAEMIRLLEPGGSRVEPPCPYFGRCGGCQWQHVDYERQVEFKRDVLAEIFRHRFPETANLEIDLMPCPQPYGYRSRTRLQLRGWGEHCRVGYYRYHSHVVEDIQSCLLLRDPLNTALLEVRREQFEKGADWEREELEIAGSADDGRWLVAQVPADLEEGFSGDGEPSAGGPEVPLERVVEGATYRIVPSVFFQANDFMLSDLVRTVMHLTDHSGEGIAADLYAGVGLFSVPLSRRFSRVLAVERSARAARLCEANARASGRENLTVICSDIVEWMRSTESPGPGTVLLDPPRTGAGPEVMAILRRWSPETIVYASCDPHTLARDISPLALGEYRIDFLRGFDLFPQTYHFETILRLSRR